MREFEEEIHVSLSGFDITRFVFFLFKAICLLGLSDNGLFVKGKGIPVGNIKVLSHFGIV